MYFYLKSQTDYFKNSILLYKKMLLRFEIKCEIKKILIIKETSFLFIKFFLL